MIMITEDLQNLYQTYLGEVPEEIVELPSSGSNRRYFRLTGTQKLIGVYGTAKEENEAFLYMAAHFRKKGKGQAMNLLRWHSEFSYNSKPAR